MSDCHVIRGIRACRDVPAISGHLCARLKFLCFFHCQLSVTVRRKSFLRSVVTSGFSILEGYQRHGGKAA